VVVSGASVCASGVLVASPGAKQAVELKAQRLQLVGECDAESYPLQKVGKVLSAVPLLIALSWALGNVKQQLCMKSPIEGVTCYHNDTITSCLPAGLTQLPSDVGTLPTAPTWPGLALPCFAYTFAAVSSIKGGVTGQLWCWKLV